MRTAAAVPGVLMPVEPVLAEVAAIEDINRGQPVAASGSGEPFHDGQEIHLNDATVPVRFCPGPQPAAAEPGQRIELFGVINDNPGMTALDARKIVTEDDTAITIDDRYG